MTYQRLQVESAILKKYLKNSKWQEKIASCKNTSYPRLSALAYQRRVIYLKEPHILKIFSDTSGSTP